jgi:hypothetical protein
MLWCFVASAADASLDLNMMLIQVREVIPTWFPFGEALGVPEDYLQQVQEMKMEDYDKLVEVLDYWFRAFPKGTQPTWRTVAMALQTVGFDRLSADIMKVYTTGKDSLLPLPPLCRFNCLFLLCVQDNSLFQ